MLSWYEYFMNLWDGAFLRLVIHGSFWYWLVLAFLPVFLAIVTARFSILCQESRAYQVVGLRFILGRIPLMFIGVAAFGFVVFFFLGYERLVPQYKDELWGWLGRHALIPGVVGVCGAIGAGIFCQLYIARIIEPAFTHRLLARRAGKKDGFSDVRTLDDDLPRKIVFQPERYFETAQKRDSMFLGLDEKLRSVLVPRFDWVKANVQIMGPQGTGKGVAACCALFQSIAFGDAVFVFDPKDDEWAPHVLRKACLKAGKSFVFVDLRQGSPAQINPLEGISAEELNELFVAGFSLGRKGSEADFYRQHDRKAARLLSRLADKGLSLPEIYDVAFSHLGDFAESASGFIGQLEELAEVSSIQTREGVSLADCIEHGGCVYIVGAMRDEAVITLQKMVFVRLLQLVECRKRGGRHVTAFLDEFKYLMSSPAINALGTVRDKGMNVLLAHQSLGDLEQCSADINPSAALATVVDTTPIKWCYRTKTRDTAAWVSDQTGSILVERTMRETDANEAMGEVEGNSRRLIQAERALIDINTVQHLPDSCAVCIGVGQAKLAFAGPIRAEQQALDLIEAPPIIRESASEALLVAPKQSVEPLVKESGGKGIGIPSSQSEIAAKSVGAELL